MSLPRRIYLVSSLLLIVGGYSCNEFRSHFHAEDDARGPWVKEARRYSYDMSNLTPEVRVNKNGVPVIKHVRDGSAPAAKTGLLSRLIPVISPSFRASSRQRRTELTNEVADIYVASRTEHKNRIREYYSEREIGEDKAEVKERFSRYSPETLELIHSAYAGNGDELRTFFDLTLLTSEETVRSLALYHDCNVPYGQGKQIFDEVASSVGVKTLGSFEAGSHEHGEISVVISLAVAAGRSRASKLEEELQKRGEEPVDIYDRNAREEKSIRQMTPPLSRIALEYPDRIQDIADYMATRGTTPETLNEELLRTHLNTPLGSGAL